AWILKHPLKIVPVLGTMKLHRLMSGFKALDIELTHRTWYELYTHSQIERMP
ncbi:MAG TPA: aldo/keto reductase, partial [Erysipelothrix sp.]|nr:aldo/keto reductase [Erysipelothrix sp.]